MANSQKCSGEGAKVCWAQGAKVSQESFAPSGSFFLTGATPFCTGAKRFSFCTLSQPLSRIIPFRAVPRAFGLQSSECLGEGRDPIAQEFVPNKFVLVIAS